MFTRRLILAAARLAFFAALFAQGVVAANACLSSLSAARPAAISEPSEHCKAQQQISLNLCLYHCADQSDQYSPQPVIVAAALSLPGLMPVAGPAIGARPRIAGTATHDPPIPIRFCSFLI